MGRQRPPDGGHVDRPGGHHIGDKRRAGGQRRLLDDGGRHPGLAQQHVLYFAELDPVATHLHLAIGAAQKVDVPVRQVPADIAGTVHAGTRRAVRIGEEQGRSQARAPMVTAGQSVPGHVDLPAYADRYRVEVTVQDVDTGVRAGPADRYPSWLDRAIENGGKHRALGGPVHREGSAVG